MLSSMPFLIIMYPVFFYLILKSIKLGYHHKLCVQFQALAIIDSNSFVDFSRYRCLANLVESISSFIQFFGLFEFF